MINSYFTNKKIFILSQQPWEGNFLSKHHYALELSNLGAQVVFINSVGLSKNFTEKKKINDNLTVLNYRKIFFNNTSSLKRLINVFLEYIQVKVILKSVGNPDIVWYFEQNRFLNVNYFKAKTIIFHPVDYLKTAHKNRFILAQQADFIFSISNQILNDYLSFKAKKCVINHGIADDFFKPQSDITPPNFISKTKINVGYIGKVDSQHIDWNILFKIIDKNPLINFVFIGGYNSTNPYIIDLTSRKNVLLTGLLSKTELSNYINFFHVFITSYITEGYEKIGSNSHKILEYLSTGKVVVSNFIGYYEDYQDIIVMSSNNDELPQLFKHVIDNLDSYNHTDKKIKRINFAKENTYKKQIERIENIITSLS